MVVVVGDLLFEVAGTDVVLDSWVEEDVAAMVAVASSRLAVADSGSMGLLREDHMDLVKASFDLTPTYWPRKSVYPWTTANLG